MKNIFITIVFLLTGIFSKAQVGINNENPKATLQIDAKNSVSPESTAGLGIPVLDIFPPVSPTNDQNGMLIYLRNTTDSNLEGFYYWDAIENNWEYIVDIKSLGLDHSKTIVSGSSFYPNNISGGGIQTRTVPFTTISSLDPSFSLSDGGLIVGKTATYYLVLTGGVYKSLKNVVDDYTTEILVNGVTNSVLTSTNSVPGGTVDGRSATFYIAAMLDLNKNDVLTVRTKRNTANETTVSVNTPYTLMLINMN